MRSLLLISLAVLTMAAASNPMADARAAIDAGNKAYIQALKDADPKEMTALFAPDGAVMSERGPVTEGSVAVEKLWADALKGPPLASGTITTVGIELDDNGTLAYERGTYSFTTHVAGKPDETDTGTYLTIWRKQPDGSWKIRMDAGFPPEKP
jgi:uncharacterized protein (TIGR02246 family)